MNKKLSLVRKAAVVSIALLFSVSASAKDLRLGVITPPSHQWTKSAKELAADISEQSGGELNVLVFPSGQLGNDSQVLQQMQRGSVDLAFLVGGEIANRRPEFGALFAPYLVETTEQATRLLQGKTATAMLDTLKTMGLHGLGYGMSGLRQIVMNSDVSSVDDLSGKKVRTPPIQTDVDFWKALNAAPTPMPLPALYDAFANGQIDGMQIDFEGSWNSRYIDHAETVIESNHMMFPMIAAASLRTWSSLTQDQRDLVERLMDKHLSEMLKKYETIDKKYLELIKDSGVNVVKVNRSFFGEAIDAWYKEWYPKAPQLKELEEEVAAF